VRALRVEEEDQVEMAIIARVVRIWGPLAQEDGGGSGSFHATALDLPRLPDSTVRCSATIVRTASSGSVHRSLDPVAGRRQRCPLYRAMISIS
jgi:hypothetical protein